MWNLQTRTKMKENTALQGAPRLHVPLPTNSRWSLCHLTGWSWRHEWLLQPSKFCKALTFIVSRSKIENRLYCTTRLGKCIGIQNSRHDINSGSSAQRSHYSYLYLLQEICTKNHSLKLFLAGAPSCTAPPHHFANELTMVSVPCDWVKPRTTKMAPAARQVL